jgi:hypothetical protein
MQQASRLIIQNGATLIITGDAIIDKEVRITVSGTLEIQGNLNMQKEIIITNNASGSINILNDFSIGKSSQITNNGFFNVLGSASTNSEGSLTGSQPLYVGTSCSGSLCSDSQISGTLPVELVEFTSKLENGKVVLFWITQSETNNDYFKVQKSKDGENFFVFEEMQGKGTTNEVSEYSTIDFNPYEGLTYYRLEQTDFDGKSTISDAISVNLNLLKISK